MLAGQKQTIDDLAVQALSEKAPLSAAELLEVIKKNAKKNLTVQGWYKALRRLLAQEVIIKDGKMYSLNARWILGAARVIETAEKTNLKRPALQTLRLPERGKRITFHFKNLLEMDAFWAHLLLYIAAHSSNPIYYCYLPHFWFYLVHEQAESQFHAGMKRLKVRVNYLIGSNSFLDRWNANFFDPSFKHWLHPVPLYKDTCMSYNYIGGYFIEVKTSKESADEIDDLFEGVKSLEEISPLALIKIFHRESPCSITISQNKAKGERLRSLAKRYITHSRKRSVATH